MFIKWHCSVCIKWYVVSVSSSIVESVSSSIVESVSSSIGSVVFVLCCMVQIRGCSVPTLKQAS